MPFTRARQYALTSSVLDLDLLALILEHVEPGALRSTSCVNRTWAATSSAIAERIRARPALHLVGGCSDGPHPSAARASATSKRFDPILERWTPCVSLRHSRDHHGLVSWGGRLFAVGGWDGQSNRASTEVFEPRRRSQRSWCPGPTLQQRRSGHGVAVSPDGDAYAIAGWDAQATSYLTSVERCRMFAAPAASAATTPMPRLRKPSAWCRLECELSVGRHCPGVAFVGRVLFVTGGAGWDGATLASCERLDTANPELGWRPCAPMLTARYRHTLVELGGALYAAGGLDGDWAKTSCCERCRRRALLTTAGWTDRRRAPGSVARYDPVADSWSTVAPMDLPRASHSAAAFEGRLVVVGGFADGEWLSATASYDPATNSWSPMAPMNLPDSPISAAGLAVC